MTKEQKTLIPRLIMTLDARRNLDSAMLNDILSNADFASVILYDLQNDEALLQKTAQNYKDIVQNKNCALLIANDSRIAGRVGADGIHIESKIDELKTMLERHHQSQIIGFGNLRDKHTAMEAGECEPDYLFFGKLGADLKDDAHPRNLNLAAWWSDIMEIPAIVQAGASIDNFADVVATNAEFIAVEHLLFAQKNTIKMLEKINKIINKNIANKPTNSLEL